MSRQIVDAIAVDRDRILLTSNNVVRLTPEDKAVWSIDLSREWIAGGRILRLESGDMVAFLYGKIKDSGVHVIRFNPESGAQRWVAYCRSLGVGHSEYYHRANIEIEKDQLRVTSRGTKTFVELLDLASGWQIERQIRPLEPDRN